MILGGVLVTLCRQAPLAPLQRVTHDYLASSGMSELLTCYDTSNGALFTD